jgi:hypothetical protein
VNNQTEAKEGETSTRKASYSKWFYGVLIILTVMVIYWFWTDLWIWTTGLYSTLSSNSTFIEGKSWIANNVWLSFAGLIAILFLLRILFGGKKSTKAGSTTDLSDAIVLFFVGSILLLIVGAAFMLVAWDDVINTKVNGPQAITSESRCTTQEDIEAWGTNLRVTQSETIILCRSTRTLRLYAMNGHRLNIIDKNNVAILYDNWKVATYSYHVYVNQQSFMNLRGITNMKVEVVSVPL